MASTYRVLLLEKEKEEAEIYSDLIKEIVSCKIDVVDYSTSTHFLELIDQSNYQLAVIGQSEQPLVLLEQIKRLSPTTSVVVVSGNATVEEAVAAIRLGAEDYLSRPLKVEAFQ